MKKKILLLIIGSLLGSSLLLSCDDSSSSQTSESLDTGWFMESSSEESGKINIGSDTSDSISWGKIF